MWSKKFQAAARIKKYDKVLLNGMTLKLSLDVEEEDKVEMSNESQQEMNDIAYFDLLQSCNDEVSFGCVDNSEGDAHQAWMNLQDKYQPNKSMAKMELKKEFTQKSMDPGQDPDLFFVEIERIRSRLRMEFSHIIDDDDLVIHIINSLTADYDSLVVNLEYELGCDESVDLEKIKSQIRTRYRLSLIHI